MKFSIMTSNLKKLDKIDHIKIEAMQDGYFNFRVGN